MLETWRWVLSKRGDELWLLQQPEIVLFGKMKSCPVRYRFFVSSSSWISFQPCVISGYLEVSFVAVKQYAFINTVDITVISPRLNLPIFPSQLGNGPLSCPLRNFEFFFCSCGREFKTRREKILSEQAFQIDLLSHSRCMHVQYCTIVLLWEKIRWRQPCFVIIKQ